MKFALVMLLTIGIWIGLVLGLSFIEAPLKFTAPGISTVLALGIGRIVFAASNYVQLFLGAVIIICSIGMKLNYKEWISILLVSILLLLAYQSFILLPILEERTTMKINGLAVAPSYHHFLFILIETIKIILLTISFVNLFNYARDNK